jgi:hypothetical protein
MDIEANTSKGSVNIPYLVLSCSVFSETCYIYFLFILSFLSSPPYFLYFFFFISLYSLFLFLYIPFRVYPEYLSSEIRGRKLEPTWFARKARTYKNLKVDSLWRKLISLLVSNISCLARRANAWLLLSLLLAVHAPLLIHCTSEVQKSLSNWYIIINILLNLAINLTERMYICRGAM